MNSTGRIPASLPGRRSEAGLPGIPLRRASAVARALAPIAALVLAAALAPDARAQQAVFNVPSADVLEKGGIYLETDHYIRLEEVEGSGPGSFSLRGVFGLGAGVEGGANLGAFEYGGGSAPFLDATIKWRPLERPVGNGSPAGSAGLLLGDHAGVGLGGETAGQARNLAYAAGFVAAPGALTRFSAGPYFATRDVFSDEARLGVQVTLEQPIPGVEGLVFAGDWYSGDGGFASVGFIWSGRHFIGYAACSFANDDAAADVATFELGYRF